MLHTHSLQPDAMQIQPACTFHHISINWHTLYGSYTYKQIVSPAAMLHTHVQLSFLFHSAGASGATACCSAPPLCTAATPTSRSCLTPWLGRWLQPSGQHQQRAPCGQCHTLRGLACTLRCRVSSGLSWSVGCQNVTPQRGSSGTGRVQAGEFGV
jgi:hypothetical protein